MKLHTVLRPAQHIADAAESFAVQHFAANNMGYCIGTNGHLPHMTLIQTEVSDEFNIEALFRDIMDLQWDDDTQLSLGDYYHDVEKPYNGLEVLPNKRLQTIHDAAVKIHQRHGLEVLGKHGEDFWPHLTFAKSEHRLTPPIQTPQPLQGQSTGWTLEFGYRGEHSVYLGPYKP